MGETIDAMANTHPRRLRFRPQVVALAAILVAAGLGGVVLAQCDSDEAAAPASSETDPTDSALRLGDRTTESTDRVPATSQTSPSPSPSPSVTNASTSTTPPATIAPVAGPSVDTATISVTDFLERVPTAINQVPSDDTSAPGPTEPGPDLSEIATGVMMDELLATASEFKAMGWTQSGTPMIVDVRVVREPTADEPLDAVIEVCLDNSDVQILDASGRDVRPTDTPLRSLNIFVLRLVDGTWLIAQRSFPDDPDC